jgi:hypothetical protein
MSVIATIEAADVLRLPPHPRLTGPPPRGPGRGVSRPGQELLQGPRGSTLNSRILLTDALSASYMAPKRIPGGETGICGAGGYV